MILHKKSLPALAVLFLFLSVIVFVTSCKKENDIDVQAAIDKALIEEYAAENQLDGQFTVNDVYYVILEEGNGEFPYSNAIVKVTYEGSLLDGTVFDEGLISATPLTTMILGMQEGIRKIDKGGTIKMIIPSRLAYGTMEKEGIPANSVLIFVVTLIDFE